MKLIALSLLALAPLPASGHCFKVWRYPTPQHCAVAHITRYVALAPVPRRSPPVREEQIITPVLPPLDFDPCQEGDERLRGIAKLRALRDGRE